MKTWVRKTISVGVLAAGALLFAPAAAQAEIDQISWDNDGVLNGTQVAVPIQVPVNVCGNGVGIVGVGVGISGICANGAAHDIDHDDDDDDDRKGKNGKKESRTEDTTQLSGDNDGVLNGTQVYVPIQVPVNVCGNGVGIVGVGVGISGACLNGAAHDIDEESARAESRTEDTTQLSGDNDGVLNGTQVYVPIQVPINVCGNGVGIVGVGVGISGACFNGAAHDIDEESTRESRTEDLDQVSWDNDGVLNGTQVAVPIQVPINVCGNGVGIVGVGVGISGACVNGAAHDIDHDDDDDNGHDGDYKKHKKDRSAATESLPLVGSLPSLGGQTGSSIGGATQNVPVAGSLGSGVKTSKVNVGGVDPMALLG